MYVSIKNTKTGECVTVNGTKACDILSIYMRDLYAMAREDVEQFRHFKIFYNVTIINNDPRGKAFDKGNSGYVQCILSKAKHNKKNS